METKKYRNGQEVSERLLVNKFTSRVQNKQVKYKAYYYKALYLVQYTTFVRKKKKLPIHCFPNLYLATRLCRSRPVGKNSSSAYRCMTHDVYIAKTRTNNHKHTDVLLFVNDGYELDNCYSIKCSRQQEKYCVSRAKTFISGDIELNQGPVT